MFLDLGVLVGVDEIPINVFDLANGSDHLSLEGEIGDHQILLCNVNITLVGGESEALQQRLVNRKVKTRGDLRAQDVEDAVRGLPEAKRRDGEISTRGKSLRVSGFELDGVVFEDGHAALNGVDLGQGGVVDEPLEEERGIEGRDGCAVAQGIGHEAPGAGCGDSTACTATAYSG